LNIRPQFSEATLAFAEIPDDIRCPRATEQPHAFFQRALGRGREHTAFAPFDHETKLPNGNAILEGADGMPDRVPAEVHQYNHEQQPQTNSSDHRGVERHRSRVDARLSPSGFQRRCQLAEYDRIRSTLAGKKSGICLPGRSLTT